jgi:hypothetical protein
MKLLDQYRPVGPQNQLRVRCDGTTIPRVLLDNEAVA